MTEEVASPKFRISSVFFTTVKTTSAIPDILTIYLLEELLKILPAW
jgi:hypothetical protein